MKKILATDPMKFDQINLFILTFLIYSSVYPILSYTSKIYKELFHVEAKSYAYTILLSLIQIPSSFFVSRIADKYRNHRFIISILLSFFVFPFLIENLLQIKFPTAGMTWRIIISSSLSFIGFGGLNPILDCLVLNRLSNIGKLTNYGCIRVAGGLGKFTTNMIMSLPVIGNNKAGGIYLSMAFCLISIIYLFLVAPQYEILNEKTAELKSDMINDMKKNSLKVNIQNLFTISFIFLCIISFLIGIQRMVFGHYLSVYLLKNNIKNTKISKYFAYHCLLEIIVSFLNSYLDRFFGLYLCLYGAAIFSLVRTYIYAFFSIKNSSFTVFIILLAETAKGIYTAIVGYSINRIVYHLAVERNKTLGQGIIYIFYGVLTELTAGILGMIILTNSKEGGDLQKYFKITAYIGSPLILLPLILWKINKK
ncbi:hypothetical protein SLOPH_467 [Spraguea lophii 42_110]|uniref:Major facilitator superfamily associated domain-containing protein n=1 Tax=Spraguea lophii (strain 42_110) TaxID=1358809 RepID=S7W679_SPRLO|nr:hypothetical protein SLOPH_467 [Spraguea lophii 42_110]